MTSLTMNSATAAIAVGSATGVPSPSTASSTSSGSTGLNGLNQQDFIQLIVAQLQNQDPTQPSNPQDLATEFADLASVNGIDTLDTTVSQIQSGGQASQLAQAATLIGKSVAVTGGDTVTATSSGSINGAFSLGSAASSAVVSIIDPTTGAVVKSIDLSNLPAGSNNFSWSSGTAGTTYKYAVTAVSSTGAPVTATTYGSGTVSAVNLSSTNPTVSLAGVTTPIPVSSIASIIGG